MLAGQAGAANVTVGIPNSPSSQWDNYGAGNRTAYTANNTTGLVLASDSGWLNYLQVRFKACIDCYVYFYTFSSNTTYYIVQNKTDVFNVTTGNDTDETFDISTSPLWINSGEGLGVYYWNYTNGLARIATNSTGASGSKYFYHAGEITDTSLKSEWNQVNNIYISGYGSTLLPTDAGSKTNNSTTYYPEVIRYVAPGGSNLNGGINISDAWATLPYAVRHVTPNTTIYVVNGTYLNSAKTEFRNFYGNCGINNTLQIKIIAYNGTPVLKGNQSTDIGTALNIGSSADIDTCKNVIVSGLRFTNFTKLFDVRRSENITLSYNIFDNTTYSNDAGQLGGFGAKYIYFHDNIISPFVGYNSINIQNIDYIYFYNNTVESINNSLNHGAFQLMGTVTHAYIYNSSSIDIPRSGATVITEPNNLSYVSDVDYHDISGRNVTSLMEVLTAFNISGRNMSVDPYGAKIAAHQLYIKGSPYYFTLPDMSKRTHNVTFDNFTFYNTSLVDNWITVRLDGGDGVILSNFTFFNQHLSTNYDFYIHGYNETMEELYPALNVIQDVNNSQYNIRAVAPFKFSINQTDNSIFSYHDELTYPVGNSTELVCYSNYCSNTFWKYSGTDHRFTVNKTNITVRPSQNSVIVSNNSNQINISGSNYSNLTVMIGSDVSDKSINLTNQTSAYLTRIVNGIEHDNVSVVSGMANFSAMGGSFIIAEASQGAPITLSNMAQYWIAWWE